MKSLSKLYKEILKSLPKAIQTKLDNINKERGGDGIYTVRNSPYGRVIITKETFISNYQEDFELLESKFSMGFRVKITPKDYYEEKYLFGEEDKILVVYTSEDELDRYPLDEKNLTRKDKKQNLYGFINVDIRSLANNKDSIFKGARAIGRPDMEYATKEEIQKIQLCNLYIITKMIDFPFSNDPNVKKFQNLFCDSELFINNEILKKITKKVSLCPDLGIPLKYEDLIDGKQKSDAGRDKWFSTTTKINLHHIRKRKPGEQNHIHSNVFLGSFEGNMLDMIFPPHLESSVETLLTRILFHHDEEKIFQILERITHQS